MSVLEQKQEPQVEPIFQEKPVPPVSPQLATNKAVSDSFASQSPDIGVQDFAMARQQGTTLRDASTQLLYEQLGEDFIKEQLWGKVLGDPEASIEDLQWAITSGTRHLKFRELNREQTLLIGSILLNKDKPEVLNKDLSLVDSLVDTGRRQDIEVIREESRRIAQDASSQVIDEYIQSKGWDGFVSVLAQGAFNELTPILNVGTKSTLLTAFFDPLNLSWEKGRLVLLGEARQRIREELVDMSPQAREQAFEEIVSNVKKLQEDPAWGPVITNYAILEAFENIFTDEVLRGESSKNSWDRVIGNAETAFEALWSGWIVARTGRTIASMRKSGDALEAARVARAAGDRKTQSKATRWLQSEISKETGIDPAEAATARMPTPSPLRDERIVQFEGAQEALDEADFIAKDLEVHRADPIGLALTGTEKQSVVAKEIQKMTRGGRLSTQPSMGVVEELDDLSGVRFDAVISKSDDEAFGSIGEVFEELDHLDPYMEHSKILKRGADGTLEEVKFNSIDELVEAASYDLKGSSNQQLLDMSEGLSRQDPKFKMMDREAQTRAGNPRTVDEIVGDEFFIEMEYVRPYHPIDKEVLGAEGIANTVLPDWALTPNSKFSERGMIEAVTAATLDSERLSRNLERLVNPYFQLSEKSKRRVSAVNEWLEAEAGALGTEPTLYDTLAHFPTLTAKERAGYIAVRRAYEVAEDLFNNRMYRDFKAQDFKTATPRGELPRYHGKVLARDEANKKMTVYNPRTRELETYPKQDIDAIYERGGSIMKLDTQLEAPGANGKALYDQVLLDVSDYRVGDLDPRPFDDIQYPGYNFRFYEDPHYIVKEIEGASLNGRQAATARPAVKGIRTAPTESDAVRFLNRMASPVRDQQGKVLKWVDRDDPSITYKHVLARDLAQADRTLLEKDTLHKQGRLFWDKRDRTPMPSTNTDSPNLLDPVRAMDRGLQLVARQTAQEDIMRALRRGFANEYRGLDGLSQLDLMTDNINEVIDTLKTQVKQTRVAGEQAKYKRALEYARYLRTMEGVQSQAVPYFRSAMLQAATHLDKVLSGKRAKAGKFPGLERWATQTDPIRFARLAAFTMFMRLRPFRQYALQAAQPLALTGIDPLYVLSGRGLNDAYALRRGFLRELGQTSTQPDFSAKWLAKRMGLSQKEYRKLVKEVERSGLIDVVNVHAFVGGQRASRRLRLASEEETLAKLTGPLKRKTAAMLDLAQKGFDEGEMLNKYASFNLAWRRRLKEKNYKSLLEFTEDDWNKVRLDSENFALAMSPANRARYQEGTLAVTTQFMAFTHRMGLMLLGQNPAIKGKNLAKVWASGAVLMGGGFIGMQNLIRDALTDLGLDKHEFNDTPLPDGSTIIDLLSSGLVETFVNKLGEFTFDEEWKQLDLQNSLPVMDTTSYAKMFLEGIEDNVLLGLMGPSGKVLGDVLETSAFMSHMYHGWPQLDGSPGDKARWALKMVGANMVPGYRDPTLALIANRIDKWISLAGNPQDLRVSYNSLIAKGLFGINTKEAIANWALMDDIDSLQNLERDLVNGGRKFLKQMLFLKNEGKISQKELFEAARVAGEFARMAPDPIRQNVYEGIVGIYYDTDNEEDTIKYRLGQQLEFMEPSKAISHINEFERRGTLTPEDAEKYRRLTQDVFDRKKLNNEEIYNVVTGKGR